MQSFNHGSEIELEEMPAPISPFEAFERLINAPYCFFLDSGIRHNEIGKYSFLGCNPFLTVRSFGDTVRISGIEELEVKSNPFTILRWLFRKYKPQLHYSQNDPPFASGMVGYFGYELRHFIEKLPRRGADEPYVPEMFVSFYDSIIIFDHFKDRLFVSHLPGLRSQDTAQDLKSRVLSAKKSEGRTNLLENSSNNTSLVRSNFSRSGYIKAVKKVQEYIAAGDIFQVNLSQRFEAQISISAFELHRRLRRVNPAPFGGYLDCGDFQIVSSSPERFLKVERGRVETRPIKGTRPRGRDRDEDRRFAQELRSSIKDHAENIMIVDLERNDLGKVCRYGSVKVPKLLELEEHPTVFHLVSTVVGKLGEDKGCVDLLEACFPGGSITGAPKVRAMEIIDELEPSARGVYTGSIGYIDFNGNMDSNIAIRTFVVKGSKVYFHAGGGIVIDSNPESEYLETLDKARAMMRAIGADEQSVF